MTGATDQQPLSVVLVGPPGAGKSTIGRKLARELGVDLYDTDAGIEEQTGRTIPEIFAEDGEPEFRRIEEQVVRDAVLAGHGIISLGGGSVLSAATRELLHGRTVVYLEISVGEGLRRTGASTNRPLLVGVDPAAKYRELMKIRRPLYREVASVRVRTDGRSPGRVVKMILGKLGLESTLPPEDATTETPTPALEPSVSSRSRSRRRRRRGRGRGEAQPTAPESSSTTAEAVSATPATSTGDTAAAPEKTGSTRTRRGRGRGRKAQSPTVDANSVTPAATSATAEPVSTATATSATDPSASESDARIGSGRRSRRRGRRPAGPATPADQRAAHTPEVDTAPSGDSGDSAAAQSDSAVAATPGAGRSRRARARRARARARMHGGEHIPDTPAREESEQHP